MTMLAKCLTQTSSEANSGYSPMTVRMVPGRAHAVHGFYRLGAHHLVVGGPASASAISLNSDGRSLLYALPGDRTSPHESCE